MLRKSAYKECNYYWYLHAFPFHFHVLLQTTQNLTKEIIGEAAVSTNMDSSINVQASRQKTNSMAVEKKYYILFR